MNMTQSKSYARIAIASADVQVQVDIVPPPAQWKAEASLLESLTHLNLAVPKVHLLHGLGIMGMLYLSIHLFIYIWSRNKPNQNNNNNNKKAQKAWIGAFFLS